MQQQGISPRQRDLLDAAFLQSAGAAAAWQRWSAGVDWDGHLDHTSFALLPRVHRNLRAQGVEDPIFPRCKGIMHQAWLANQHLVRALAPALDALAEAGIEPVLLPPTWILSRDRAAVLDRGRPLCWGIAPGQALPALRALFALGWVIDGVRVPGWSLAGYVAGVKHLILRRPDGPRWLLTWALDLWPGDRALAAAAEPCDLAGRSVRALAPQDALCHTLWQPGGLDAFGLAAQLLTIAAVGAVRDWPAPVPASAASLPPDWGDSMKQIRHIFVQQGASADFGTIVEPPRGAPPPANPLRRAETDWQRYRVALAQPDSPTALLRQLPGYLMGRWRARHLRQLPWRALGWLVSGRRG